VFIVAPIVGGLLGCGRIGNAMVVVGNLLLDFDYETTGRVWRVPHPTFRELAVSALHERVTTLRRLGCNASSAAIQAELADAFRESLERPLKRERSATKNGNTLGRTPKFCPLRHFSSCTARRVQWPRCVP